MLRGLQPNTPDSPAASQSVHRAFHPLSPSIQHMGVDHRCLDVLVSKQLLDGTNIVTVLQEVSGKRMAEGVAGGRLGQSRPPHSRFRGKLSYDPYSKPGRRSSTFGGTFGGEKGAGTGFSR